MKLCILDPAIHIPGLKDLFPEADYFGHKPDDFFTYKSTAHPTPDQEFYRTDWESITSGIFDTLFIVAPLYDYFNPTQTFLTPYVERMKQKIYEILVKGVFKHIALFDIHDYDYDPNDINTLWRVDTYFKRNFNKTKQFKSNVHSFPFMMFVKSCVLQMCLKSKLETKFIHNQAVWCGGLYNHTHFMTGEKRNRLDMFEQIKNSVVSIQTDVNQFVQTIKQYKILVDLIGVGAPNKRTFEGLTNGILTLVQFDNLDWGFEEQFLTFTTAVEFHEITKKLLEDEEYYKSCLQKQNEIVKKYFNTDYLRKRILDYIPQENGKEDAVSIFLTSCNRPALLRKTLESFLEFNTYPIEECIIVEDSGLQGINDFVHTLLPFPTRVIYAEKRRGQMKSIENGLQFVKTPFVFHCEEDWRFYKKGFIEDSMEILKKDEMVTTVWLRSQNDIRTRYNMPITQVPNENYYKVGPNIGNFSWNPGLKTIEIAKKFAPYSTNELLTICEGGMDKAFRSLGMTSAMTKEVDGYVEHIGWNDHVY